MLDGSTAVSIEPVGAGGALLSGHGADSRSLACGRRKRAVVADGNLLHPTNPPCEKLRHAFPSFLLF